MVSFTGAGSPATAGASGTTTGTATAVATTTAPAATPSPAMAKTYVERYRYMPDILNQSYASLYDKADLLSSSTPTELLNQTFLAMMITCAPFISWKYAKMSGILKTVKHVLTLDQIHNLIVKL